jgi:hypothetical protein
MTKIKSRNDGPGGRNDSYDIRSRKSVARSEVVREIEQGKDSGRTLLKLEELPIRTQQNPRDVILLIPRSEI